MLTPANGGADGAPRHHLGHHRRYLPAPTALGVCRGESPAYQPALDSRYRYPRFPFFDLSGGANTNNFTQFFLSLEGSL